MKKLAWFLCVIFSITVLILSGCGSNKDAATGSLNGSVSITSSPIQEAKQLDNTKDLEDKNDAVQANQFPVELDKQEAPPQDKTQSQPSSSPISEATSTTTVKKTEPSLPTAVAQAPLPITPEKVNEEEVTIAIYCSTAVAKGLDKQDQFKEVVPSSGIILPPTKVKFKNGETVFDALKLVVREHKIHMQYEGSKGNPYIKGINNLYEFDGGPLSGWMFSLNKGYTNNGCNQTELKNGDLIEWNYTCDMGKDLLQ